MTPVINPVTQTDIKYNTAHIRTRNSVERTIEIWKRRFPCLSLRMRTKLETTAAVVVATAVLHILQLTEETMYRMN